MVEDLNANGMCTCKDTQVGVEVSIVDNNRNFVRTYVTPLIYQGKLLRYLVILTYTSLAEWFLLV